MPYARAGIATGTGSGEHQMVYEEQSHQRSAPPRRIFGHKQNKSLVTAPTFSTGTHADVQPASLTFPDAYTNVFQPTARPSPRHALTRSLYVVDQDKPLPPPPLSPAQFVVQEDQAQTKMGVDMSSQKIASVNTGGNDRADMSYGSWLEDEESYVVQASSPLEDENSFDLEDYLLRPPTAPSPQPSTTTERPARRPRAPTPSRASSFIPQSIDSSRGNSEFFGDPSSVPSYSTMASYKPTPIQTDSSSLAKAGLTHSGSESEGLYDLSPPPFARPPKAPALPDPSTFADPYPHGLSYHHPPSATPALSSAGSASTRSSAYTNPGSTMSTGGFSGDYSHVRVASGDDTDGAIVGMGIGMMPGTSGLTSDAVVEMLSRASNGSSLSSGSRKSHGHVHVAHMPMPRIRRADYARSARSLSQPDDLAPPIMHERGEHALRTQPSYDTSWQRDHEDFGTSEEEYDYGDQQDGEEDDEEGKEEDPGSAIVVAEEGRGLIVHGEGMPVQALTVQSGITHLLVGSSSTPNSVPSFLTTTLPQISMTLLALDISANFLASLSPALALCASLEELNISANPLRVLPEFLADLASLRLLIADSTGISTIPTPLSALDKLHTLSVRRNKMHALPSWLCTLPCLESLLVDGNPFQGPWKALVDPLLAKTPMTPMYPPSTPMIPQLSATYSSASNTTTGETTDVSDAEDLTDQDDTTTSANSALQTHTLALPSQGDADLDEDTITPAHARLLGRSATAPCPHIDSSTSPPSPRLSRTRTTPNRGFYERDRKQREQTGEPSSSALTWGGDKRDDTDGLNVAVDSMPSSPNLAPAQRGELRRMRSADELGRAMQSSVAGPSQAVVENASLPSPPRPGLSHFATSPTNGLAQGRRFATLNVHTRAQSRSGSRSLAHSLWGEPAPEDESDADMESPPPARSRAASNAVRRSREDEREQPARQTFGKQKGVEKEKEKSGRKWGFLKKMSMGKLRTMDGAPSHTPSSSRPSTSLGVASTSFASGRLAPISASATPRQLSPPQLEDDGSSSSANTASPSISSPPSSLSPPHVSLQNFSTDKLKIPTTPLTPSSAGLLAPPSPLSKASKRRSFLPIDGPPALNIPIPNTAPFLGGLTATNGGEDLDEASRQPSPVTESPQDLLRKEEERNREGNARALRSVMAYLKDMNDLTLLSQGNVLSMYGGSAPLMERSRRPTLVDGTRKQSEASIDSIDSASSATASSHLRSLDSILGNRNGSLNTMSIATTDSSGSGEERKCKDDRGKRVMIVREIVETERTYVKNLQDLVDIYVRPAAAPVTSISKVASSSKETVIPAAERKVVFGGLEALFIFHKESFLPALERAAAPLLSQSATADADSDGKLSSEVAMSVGRSFVAHAAFMKMYSSYINNFENSVSRIRQWVVDRSAQGPGSSTTTPSSSSAHLANGGSLMSPMAQNAAQHESASAGKVNLTSSQRKRIKSYLKRCRINPRHSQLNLEGYLLLPVQRIPRYRLLLEDLTRSTPPPSNSYDDPLDRALTEISSLATNMNEGKREAESRNKLVQWQARIRGKFPSPLVQPHRRLIMDGKLLLTRIVRKQTMAFEVFDSHGDASNVAVDCLAPELTPRPLYGVLCNDLFVLCRDPSNGQDPNSPVDLWAVLRMQTMPQPTSIVHGNTLRIVDTKAILYLEAPSTSEALTWFRAINMHVPIQKLDA